MAGLAVTATRPVGRRGLTVVYAVFHGMKRTIRFSHRKYYFPPKELLVFLNALLQQRHVDERFVAYVGGTGECVALASAERVALGTSGVRVVFSQG